ncbi:ABC transporter ATP-binding protein [Glutamicibacter sp.]|uniref:ABC transporter ATP-binding protein n=1 Tax=Glutamicibacter sp. TaxID=1931995 RepID=UPI002B48A3A1|nr:ABC transporter ATP-binding protein [Glutamicibacter sp.]HJX79401.1 ABC transporter ATP-binding protein [Glutamicibacter sp.]
MIENQKNSRTGNSVLLDLKIEHFRYSGAELDSLQDIKMTLSPGSLTVIVGESGSGKSTLGELFAGILPRQGADQCSGTTNLAGQQIEYADLESQRINIAGWAKHVGLLPQEAGHYLSRIRETVAEELVFSLENEGMQRDAMRQRIAGLSKHLNLDHLLERDPAKLSGGQERLVALAALAISEPSVMVLDEPLAGLDSEATVAVTEMISRLRADGTAMVVLSRTATPWADNADSLMRIANGQLAKISADNLVQDSASVPTQRRAIPGNAEVLLDFSGVQLGYEGAARPVLDGLDLQVRAGECVGLAGANGSGKTTVLKAAAGLLRPTAGTLAVSTATGMLLQNSSDQLFERTVMREVSFGLPKKGTQRLRVPEVLSRLGLEAFAETHPYELPASARRLVALATVLVREPTVLLLDEPTEALDSEGMIRLQQVIDSVLSRGGAVLLSTHDRDFMHSTTHRIHQMPGNPEPTARPS